MVPWLPNQSYSRVLNIMGDLTLLLLHVVLEVLIGLKQVVHYHSLDCPVLTCSSLVGRVAVDSLDADLPVLFGDGVLSPVVALLALGVGGLFLKLFGVLPIPPPLLLVILMLESIVGGG
jgi:hypothetical protein